MPTVHKVASILTLALASAAPAQTCTPHWAPGTGLPGPDKVVNASMEWDPDGPGPRPSVLVCAGQFTAAGTTRANSVAMWDGQTWSPIGTGFDEVFGGGVGAVRSLAVYNGELIAGGNFQYCGTAGDSFPCGPIARWDGSAWRSFTPPPLGYVSAMLVHNGELIVAGSGYNVGFRIVRWNGSAWSIMGQNIEAYSLVEYNGEVYAGGNILIDGAAGVARWNGTDWVGAGVGVPQDPHQQTSIDAMTVLDGYLYAAGRFANPGGQVPAGIARWDGATWTSLPIGAATTGFDAYGFYTMIGFDHRLVVCGSFATSVGGAPYGFWAWDGVSWTPMDRFPRETYTLATYRGTLVAGGTRAWNGAIWVPLRQGTDGFVHMLRNFQGDVVAAGEFRMIEGVPADGLARWDGRQWHAIPIQPGSDPGYIRALGEYQGGLIVAGDFTSIGGVQAHAVARWDGQAWHAMGDTSNGPFITAMAEYHGVLYVVGYMWDVAAQRWATIERWDGAAWSSVVWESDLPYQPSAAMAIFDDQLFVCPNVVSNAYGQNSTGPWVYRFDGTTWTSTTQIVARNPGISSLCVFNGSLLGGGGIVSVGGTSARMVKWIGSATTADWQGIATPLGVSTETLCSAGGHLYAFGGTGVWRQDGSAWTPIGTTFGYPGAGHFAAASHGELMVAGVFTGVDSTVSGYVAHWTARPDCPADFDCSGSLTINDIVDILNAWFAQDNRADFNGVNGIDIQDIFDFFAAWFAGCP